MLQEKMRRAGTTTVSITPNGNTLSLSIPAGVEGSDFPREQGAECEPRLADIRDPDTGEEKTALIYIPQDD